MTAHSQLEQNSHHASTTNQHRTKDRLNLNNRGGTRQGELTRHRGYQSGQQTGYRWVTGEGQNQEVAEADGGGVSGQRQETHGRTRQSQQAHDNINKQEKAHVRNEETQKENRAGS